VEQALTAGADRAVNRITSAPRVLVGVLHALWSSLETENSGAAKAKAKGIVPKSESHVSSDIPRPLLSDLRRWFIRRAPQHVRALRGSCVDLSKTEQPTERALLLAEALTEAHTLAKSAAIAEDFLISQLAGAFEALLHDLMENPKHVNAPLFHSLAQSVDLLGLLLEVFLLDDVRQLTLSPLILVLDANPGAGSEIKGCLHKAFLNSVTTGKPEIALELAAENSFDLVIVTVATPTSPGFEFCDNLRAQSSQQDTPLIFVAESDLFEVRAKIALSHGAGVVTRPFLELELALRVLTSVLQRQVHARLRALAPKTNPSSLD
jgi:PleD family two-component response regulator